MYRNNQNFLCVVYGPTGSGKSYSCLKLCELLDPHFNVDNVVFDAKQFIQLVNSGKLKAGSAILFEELGVAANSRNWYKEENMILSFITQVFRTKNYIVFYTVPRLEFVDMQIAKLVHAHIEALKVDRKQKRNVVKIFDPVHYDSKKNKWYRNFPSFVRDGKSYKANRYVLKKVNKQIAKKYEVKRDVYLNKITQDAQTYFEKEKEQIDKKHFTASEMKEIVDEIVRNKLDYMDDKRFNSAAVMENFKVGGANARRIKQAVRKRLSDIGFVINWR